MEHPACGEAYGVERRVIDPPCEVPPLQGGQKAVVITVRSGSSEGESQMLKWLKGNRAGTNGPDFSAVDSQAKVEDLYRRRQLHKLILLPVAFGGEDIPPNVVYVPEFVVEQKARIDRNVIQPLIAKGSISRYRASPEYQGDSFVPSSITIVASDPGSFTARIAIWGEALEDEGDGANSAAAVAAAPADAKEGASKWAAACQAAWDEGNGATVFEYCSKAADEGDAKSQYILGNLHFEGISVPKDENKGAELWLKAAAAGVAEAQHNVGRLYQKGIMVEQSFAKAMAWYEKAAAQGDTYSMHNIGYFHEFGKGVEADPRMAEEWYTRAASRGLANSQYNLAAMYYDGDQLPQDKVKAYAWMSLALAAQYPHASDDWPALEKNLTPEEKEAGRKLARTLVIK